MLKRRFWKSSSEASCSTDSNLLAMLPSFSKGRKGAASGTRPDEALLLFKEFEESGLGWFWATDAAGHLTYLSESISQTISAPDRPLLDSPFADYFVQADKIANARLSLPFVLSRQSPFEKLIVRAGNKVDSRCWSVSGYPQFDKAGQFTGYRGSAIDVTEHRSFSKHVAQLAKYDSLTGLPNRHRMSEVLEASLLAAEHQKRPCAVLLIDLDRFKQVNDTLGHPAGDVLLKQVAERLLRIVGDKEKVFRPGGDEFQIILQNCQDRGIIGDMATDIIASLSQPYSVHGSRCIIGASVGVAVAPVDGSTREDLIRNADLALYAAKSNGRGKFRFFSSDLLQAAEDKRLLEEDLRDALAKGEMTLAYQPIMNATTNRMTGVEALLRWNHPTRGSVSPALFIPIAEEADLIRPLGEWVLRKACEDAATWPEQVRVAVNVSPLQFSNEAFPSIVMSALASSGISPQQLELEITEGVFLGDTPETDTMFNSLKSIGVRLALDDFGTGYSSLGYLRTAPFDKIKIDQTFVRAATLPGSRNSAIIAAIVALADALEMETTAEGIEFMDQLHLIRKLGVSHAQGWVYSKAISSEELIQRLNQGDWVIEPSGPAKHRSERQAMYRKVGVIHGNKYESALIRNLSETGALIEGISGLLPDTLVVVDFGDGELAFARVTRSAGHQLGIAFEQHLVDDGDGGLCTSHRVSPYLLSTVGLPSQSDPEKPVENYSNTLPLEELAAKLGLTLAPRRTAQEITPARSVSADEVVPTFRQLSVRYLEAVQEDEQTRLSAKRDLRNHILPRFGQLRLDQVSQADIFAWLAAKVEVEDHPPGTDSRLHFLLNQMWTLAVRLGLPGAEPNPLEGQTWISRRSQPEGTLTVLEAQSLIEAAQTSHNRQLKFIVLLLMLTGARHSELLNAKWEDVDLDKRVWRISVSESGRVRELPLTDATIRLLSILPRWTGCPYLLANPTTKKPYRSISKSWDVVKVKAGLRYLELEDLRYCDISAAFDEGQLQHIVRQMTADAEVEASDADDAEAGDSVTAAQSQPARLDKAA